MGSGGLPVIGNQQKPAESWLNQQAHYDLWLARQNQQHFKVERLLAT